MKNQNCQNCDQPLNGEYCSNCGQRDIELLKFKKLIKDFFDHHLDLDSRLFRTIKYLITNPGFLTAEYWNGRRAKYVPPLKLYLITSFIFFLVYSLNIDNQLINNDLDKTKVENQIDSKNNEYDFEDYLQKNRKILELILLLPLTALGLQLINKNISHLYFSHHFIASIHLMSMWFIIDTIVVILILIFPKYSINIEYLEFTSLIYITIMVKNIYNLSTIRAILKSLLLGAFVLSISMLCLVVFIVIMQVMIN